VSIVVAGAIMTAVTAWFAWVAWFMHRMATSGKRHRTTLPHHPAATAAAHHPLPTVVDLGPDTATWPAPRHTHRDPTTGRFVPRGKL